MAATPASDWTALEPIEPHVLEEREFLEIAEDFSNPREIFREAISNSFDAKATEITISLSIVRKGSRDILRIELADNGKGMTREELQAFFDLGNSTSRDKPDKIGEKGHGTKIYYKSSRVEVITNSNGLQLRAQVDNPYDALASGQKPKISVESRPSTDAGTRAIIDDYNHSIRDQFTHEQLKDYILWFTKFGSVEMEFGELENKATKLFLKGVDRNGEPELIRFGHVFPEQSPDLSKLLDEHKGEAADHFVKRWTTKGRLRNFPDIEFSAIFYLEGDTAKRAYNPMIRGKGRALQPGMYTVQDRYGLWLCRDHIPVQRMNQWIVVRGGEFTRFHAFVNCQRFRLTANRGTVTNTPPEVLDDIEHAVSDYFRNKILAGTDYSDIEYLERESAAFITAEKDERDFGYRIEKLQKKRVAKYKGVELIEPDNEIGVVALVIALLAVDPKAFPFKILDYVTYRGYDALATLSREDLPLEKLSKAYIEFKFRLACKFDHLFKHLTAIVCWQTDVRDGDEVEDAGGTKRRMRIHAGTAKEPQTKYFLEAERSSMRIEAFVLEEYLKEVWKIEFKPRRP